MRQLVSYSRFIWLTLLLAACCTAGSFWLLSINMQGNRDLHRNSVLADDLGQLGRLAGSSKEEAAADFRALAVRLDQQATAWPVVRADVTAAVESMARSAALRRSMQDARGEDERKHLQWALQEESDRAVDALQSALARVRQLQLQLASDLFSRTRLLLMLALVLSGMVILVAFQLRMHYVSAGRQRQIESALRTSETRFRELFQSVPIGVYQSRRDGSIIAVNDALVRMLGYASEDELRAHKAGEVYSHPDVRTGFIAQLERDGFLRNVELELRRRDGKLITVLENARTVRSDSGELLYYEGTMTDITHLKEVERELEAARDEAIAGSRLKSEFLANVSHEIRTPMNGVIGMTSLLLGTPLGREQHEYATAVRRSAEFLLAIIDDILDFSRTESGRLEVEHIDFALSQSVEDVAEMLAGEAAARGIELACDIDEEVPEIVRGDPKRLRQVITNLVGNAIKFTDAGHVLITVNVAKRDATDVLLRFSVRDTGIGITPEQRARIFEPFCQGDGSTTRRYGGTGLGLSISQRLVELMGGEIQLSSDPGRGSTFTFHLRLGAAATEERAESVLSGVPLYLAAEGSVTSTIIAEHARAWGMNVVHLRHASELPADGAGGVVIAEPDALAGAAPPACPVFVLRNFARTSAADEENRLPEARIVTRPVRLRRLRTELGRAVRIPRGASPTRNRVLIAEDNALNQTIAQRLVEKLGYEAVVVPSGIEAVEEAESGDYELVLMDCQMPRMDGFAATAEIRRRERGERRLPVIAMTANALDGDRDRCLASGMDDYLTKPVSADELAAILRRWTCGAGSQPAADSQSA
jgi:PAS domain S-box-containing protein